MPARHHHDLDAAVQFAFEQAGTAVAAERRQLGYDRAAEVIGVLHRALASRACGPDAFDHQSALGGSASPPPITTAHGRTRQEVTSPSRTYGSARAKSSTAAADSARNTSSAASAGSPSAPAITS